MVWFIARNTKVHLSHLRARLIQSGHWNAEDAFDHQSMVELLKEKLDSVDLEKARKDVAPFLRKNEHESLGVWSRDFFIELIQKIESVA